MGGATLYSEYDTFKEAKKMFIQTLDDIIEEGTRKGWSKSINVFLEYASIHYDSRKKKYVLMGRLDDGLLNDCSYTKRVSFSYEKSR